MTLKMKKPFQIFLFQSDKMANLGDISRTLDIQTVENGASTTKVMGLHEFKPHAEI